MAIYLLMASPRLSKQIVSSNSPYFVIPGMMKSRIIIISSILFLQIQAIVFSQHLIHLDNPSFEDKPRSGGSYYLNGKLLPIEGWVDCGFPGYSPPDIHPTRDSAWGVWMKAVDGRTYLGMVARYDLTWEAVTQKLYRPLRPDTCYLFKASLAISENYKSRTTRSKEAEENFSNPLILQIWGGSDYCNRGQLLAQSPPINNNTWKEFSFLFHPTATWDYILLEAFYYFPSTIPEDEKIAYCGHILVDHLSPIIEVPCRKD